MYVKFPSIQNNCSSLKAFSPEFKIGSNSLIFSASLNKRIFQFLCLSVISVSSCTKLIRVVLKSNLSLFWIGANDVKSDECKDAISNVEHQWSRWDVCKQHCYCHSKHVQLSFHMLFLFCQCNWHHNQDMKNYKL